MIYFVIITALTFQQVLGSNNASGILLLVEESYACKDVAISSFENTEFCLFLKITSNEGTILQMELTTRNITLLLEHKGTTFNMKINEEEHQLKRRNILKRWMKICVILSSTRKISIEINHVEETLSLNEESKVFEEMNNITDSGNEILNVCIGNSKESSKSFVGEASAMLFGSDGNLSNSNMNCFKLLNENFEDFKLWDLRAISVTQNKLLPICLETQSVLLQSSYVSYPQQASICTSLSGRLLLEDEIKYLEKDLNQMSRTVCEKEKNNYKIFGTWTNGSKTDIESMEDQCTLYNFNDDSIQQPCIIESFCNCCIFPYQISIRLYGSVKKFDSAYTLNLDKINNIRSISGSESSEIVLGEEKQWILRSKLHNDEWILYDQVLPLGRKNWKNSKTKDNITLTFTTCSKDDFTCNDGSCVNFKLRCNGVVNCKDESDENDCVLIEKKRGYRVKDIAPPEDGDDLTEISFYTFIYNIADISASNGKIDLNIGIVFYWKDSRLKFWNPENEEEIDCKTIWRPIVEMADGYPNGMMVDHKEYRLTCRIDSSSESLNSMAKISSNDSYMGRFVDGKNVELYMFHAAKVTLYCRFDLRKYPFGKQTCTLDLWSDHNSLNLGDHRFVPNSAHENKSEVSFLGIKMLGEYYFVDSYFEVTGREDQILVSIVLQTLFGFHILNNFTPSVLICIISLGTLLFPLSDFNERIMVSLTALLVLAALFNQASGTSIKTSYFKYIDIWYVTLITFSFLIVITNIGLRIYKKKEEEHIINVQMPKYTEKVDQDDFSFKKTRKLNKFSLISYTVFLLLFSTFYSLLAAEYI